MVLVVRTKDALLRLMDLNLAEANREQARFLAPCRLLEQDDVLYAAGGTRWPAGPFNSVVAGSAECPDAPKTLAHADAFFRELGRGFTVYVRAHLDAALAVECARTGLAQMSDAPGMALVSRLASIEPPASVQIRDVRTAADVGGFVGVLAAAYTSIDLPAKVTQKVFGMPHRWSAPHLQPLLLLDHDEPASAAILHFSHGIAGIYWVGTAPGMRGKGHASLLMRYVSNLAFAQGAAAVVLQATPFGEPVYRKLGYEEMTRYPCYVAPRR
jgi:ribosomal protein S18 acetylase RimI-like enzyme